jgi:cyclin B/cyclin A
MFLASKYEDVYPLLMKTVYNKIGHQKLAIDAIRTKEQDLLKTLNFNIGGAPTTLEFLEKYIE